MMLKVSPSTRAVAWLSFAAFVAALFFMQIRLATNVDVAFNIIAGQKIWAGLNYPDGIRDINPPLIALLNVPPVALSKVLPISLPVVFVLYVYLLALFSVWLICAVVPPQFEEGRGFALATLVLLLVLLFVLPGIEFGEREHFICIMAAPYLCLVARRWQGQNSTTAATIVCVAYATVGFCLKPTLLALPAIIFLIDAWRTRSLRPLFSAENLTVAGVVLVYLAIIFLFFPGYLTIAADAVHSYSGYRSEPMKTMTLAVRFALPGVFCLAIATLLGTSRTLHAVLWLCGLLLIVGTVTAVAQMKDWSYHFLPVLFAGGMICGVVILLTLRRWWAGQLPALAAVTLLVAAFVGLAQQIVANQAYSLSVGSVARMERQPLFAQLRDKMRGAYVMNLTPAIGIVTQAIHDDAKWGSRLPSQHEWPFVYANMQRLSELPPVEADRVRKLDADLKAGLAADMAKFRPKFAFVEIGPEVSGVEDVDILKYFLADRAVAEQWSHYSLYDDPKAPGGILMDGRRKFQVYERRD